MLEVHPPHHPTHSWRDFFLHIATIAVGLLIAVGIEQTVEFFHHRHQVAAAREALREERDLNIRSFSFDARAFGNETKRFQTNLAVLLYIQQHPKATMGEWPGVINWHNHKRIFSDSAWDTVRRGNIAELMPQAEVREADRLYKELAVVSTSFTDRLAATRNARAYMVSDFDPARLTPAQLEDEIQLAKTVLAFQYRLGGDMRNLGQMFPDFSPAPSTVELDDMMHEPHEPAYTSAPSIDPLPAGNSKR